MEKELMFHILQIQETKDEEEIVAAYHKLLKETNPEDDPEGFKRLRQAYEEAMNDARHSEDKDEEETEKDDVDLWIDRVEELYQNITLRNDVKKWEKLLADPVCEGLDTSLEAREKMIVYLMSHCYLPDTIWRQIDHTFQIVEDIQTLSQQFPMDFLNYVRFHVENGTFIPYELFTYIGGKEEGNADAYIGKYLEVKGRIDENNPEGCLKELDDMKAYGVYHPFEDVERMKVLTAEKEHEKALELAEKLQSEYSDYTYVMLYVGEAKWYSGQKEEAHQIWKDILEKQPDHYTAKYNLVKYQMEMNDYYHAKESMIDLLEISGRNEELESWLQTANESLIEQYKDEIKNGKENPNFPGDELEYELGWCLFQNERFDEAVNFMQQFKEEQKATYDYCNLYGRLLYEVKRYEEALPYLQKWLKLIEEMKDDGTEKTRKRMSRRGRAGYILGGCYYEMGRQKEAEETLKEAIRVMEEPREQMGCRQYLAYILMKSKQFERAVDICDGIIQEDENYYPAYLIRQESCYELRKAQEVVDDYHRAIEIVPEFFQPYMYAAEVFFFYGQYEDAKGVYELARENGVEFSDRMKLYEAKVLRNLAKSSGDREVPRGILEELKEKQGKEDSDIEDSSEIEYEIGLLDWDDDKCKQALEHMKKAIGQNPDRKQYRMIRGNICFEMKEYKEAIEEYNAAEEEYEDDPWLWYSRGRCYEETEGKKAALGYYEKALELKEGYRDACERISEYYENLYHKSFDVKNLQTAIAYMDRQVAATENCYYLVARGLIYLNVLDLEPAIRDFEKALEYSENDWAAWNNLGCCYKYMGEFEKAIKHFNKAVECMGEDYEVLPYSNMADCYEALRDYETAIECYKKDLEMFPDRLGFWEEIGDLYSYMKKYDEAIEAYKKAGNGALEKIGDVWLEQGNQKKCLYYYKKARMLAPKEEQAEHFSNLGEVYMCHLAEYKKAISYFKRAIRLNSDPYERFDYERYIARCYYMLGNYEKARKHGIAAMEYFEQSGKGTVEQYIGFAPYAPARLATMAWIYLCMGMKDKAVEYYNKMDTIKRCRGCRHKECFESRLYMGFMYEAEGDMTKALEEYEKALERNPHCFEAACAVSNLQKVKG